MNSLPIHGEHGGGVAPTLADQLRAIALPALLAWHGLAPKPEGASFRAKSDHHNLVVTGNRWFDNRTGTAGAIDLQMHLTGEDFSAASRTLADQFRPAAICRQGIIFPSASANRSDSERLLFPQLMAKYAAKDDGNWPLARCQRVR